MKQNGLIVDALPRPDAVIDRAALDSFVSFCDVKELTAAGYITALKVFARWMNANGITQPTRADIKTYKLFLQTHKSEKTGRHFSAGTQARYMRACKQFFRWASSEGYYPNIADNIKPAKTRADNTHRDALPASSVKQILNSIDTSTERGARDYAMILLCVTCGLRIIEIQRADVRDITTIAGKSVLFIQGKGRDEKDEFKQLSDETRKAIFSYLEKRNAKKTEPLFTGTSNRAKGERITEQSISRIIKTILIEAGYDSERITAHSLRHTSVTLLLLSGATLQQAQHHARHASPTTTGIYAHNIDKINDKSTEIITKMIFEG